MEQNSNDFSTQDILRLAQSPAGRQLIALLQSKGGTEFQDAMKQAADGDYRKAKKSINQLLSTPEAQALLKQLGR